MQSIGNIQKLWKFLPQILILLTFVSPVLSGFACLSNPCIHGVCLDDLNTTYSCYCIDGYTGIQCQTNWDECWSNPCQNGGICHDGIASFNCTCPPGFVGNSSTTILVCSFYVKIFFQVICARKIIMNVKVILV